MTSETVIPEQSLTEAHPGFSDLSGLEKLVADAISKPRWLIYAATAVAVAVAWFWLAYLTAGVSDLTGAAALGPGMGIWDNWLTALNAGAASSPLIAFIVKLCTPQTVAGFGLTGLVASFLMWTLMSVAMMLPSAAPMMRTYADIADVAAGKGQRVVPLYILIAGYLSIWVSFAFLASLAQLSLVQVGLSANTVLPLHGFLAGPILLLAGIYQFSPLKEACLEKCRNPFTVLFANWSDTGPGVFRLGWQQGLFCLGCCWALMLVMLVVGTMNLSWMAFFTLFAIIEKSGAGKVTSRVTGCILLLWGGILLAFTIAEISTV